VTAALNHLSLSIKKRESMSTELEAEAVTASCGCQGAVEGGRSDVPDAEPVLTASGDAPKFPPSGPAEGLVPSQEFGLVYALGTLGYDFGTEARRDTFKQLMPPFTYDQTAVPGNPFCRLIVEVSDLLPVTLGEVRTWMTQDRPMPLNHPEPERIPWTQTLKDERLEGDLPFRRGRIWA
jgi:hypothetical protein